MNVNSWTRYSATSRMQDPAPRCSLTMTGIGFSCYQYKAPNLKCTPDVQKKNGCSDYLLIVNTTTSG